MPKKLRITQRKERTVKADTRNARPDPAADRGSLRELFEGKTSKELIEEARKEEANAA